MKRVIARNFFRRFGIEIYQAQVVRFSEVCITGYLEDISGYTATAAFTDGDPGGAVSAAIFENGLGGLDVGSYRRRGGIGQVGLDYY